MRKDVFDTIIVGARCAGAPLATHLARKGQRVLLLDADRSPSGQAFSTHAIQPRGLDYLEELGVARTIRKVTPAVTLARFTVNGRNLDISFGERDMRAPRRTTLDPLLQDAAVRAGADLRDEASVLELLETNGRVTGVKARRGGHTEEFRARIVVGADGRNSTVARKVRAEEYCVSREGRVGYWNYWPTPAIWNTDARWPFQVTVCMEGEDMRSVFETDGGQLLIGVFTTLGRARTWGRNPQAALDAEVRAHPLTAPLVAGQEPLGRPVGLLRAHFCFRQATGPGWALVGDAGLHKDPTPGLGITDALRDAKSLAAAILDGREAALELYWRERDVLSMPLYFNAGDMGSTDYANPLTELAFERMNESRDVEQQMRRVFDREISPYDMIPPQRILKWTLGALGKGRTDILLPLFRSARRAADLHREMRVRRKLLVLARRRAEERGYVSQGS